LGLSEPFVGTKYGARAKPWEIGARETKSDPRIQLGSLGNFAMISKAVPTIRSFPGDWDHYGISLCRNAIAT